MSQTFTELFPDDDIETVDERTARERSARRRTLDLLENVPSTHDIDRCIVIGIRRWLANLGVETLDDIQDTDGAARALIDRIVEAVRQSRFDTTNQRTRNRLWVRLGLEPPMHARPRHDELTR